jgi:hypothetical protein
MMEMYGRAVMEERLKPRQHAELAAYVRREYGSSIGPGFLLAEIANGTSGKGRRRRDSAAGILHAFARAVKALVPANTRLGKTSTDPR